MSNLNETIKSIELRFRAKKEDLEESAKQVEKSFSEKLKESFKDFFERLKPKNFFSESVKELKNSISTITNDFVKALNKTFKNVLQEFKTMYSYSTLSNAGTRELMLSYGLSSSQAYGFSKASNLLGYNSLEDAIWAAQSNPEEYNQFVKAMTSYSEKYDELYDSGFFQKYMELNWEWQQFKDEIMYDAMDAILKNKDTIMAIMNIVGTISRVILSIADWLINLTGGTQPLTASEILNQYSTTGGTNTSIQIDNTFNNIDTSNQQQLIHAGQQTYKPIIELFKVNY